MDTKHTCMAVFAAGNLCFYYTLFCDINLIALKFMTLGRYLLRNTFIKRVFKESKTFYEDHEDFRETKLTKNAIKRQLKRKALIQS